MSWSCIICGVGGQGSVLASKILAMTTVRLGLKVRTSETIGMAQRGGCVVSHIRVGDGVYSPMVPLHGADLIVGFEPAEAVRCIDYLKPDGACVVSARGVRPITDVKGEYSEEVMIDFLKGRCRCAVLDTDRLCRELGSYRVLNILLIGAALDRGLLPFGREDIEESMKSLIKPHLLELNRRALLAAKTGG